MNEGSSEQVRNVAKQLYVNTSGSSKTIKITLGEIQRVLLKEGFPSNHIRQIRTSLESSLFWEPLGLQMVSPRNQPDRVGTTLVFTSTKVETGDTAKYLAEDPLMRLRGILKGAMREGAAAFLHELRRDKENEQADEVKRVA
jgi:hypothetical protein